MATGNTGSIASTASTGNTATATTTESTASIANTGSTAPTTRTHTLTPTRTPTLNCTRTPPPSQAPPVFRSPASSALAPVPPLSTPSSVLAQVRPRSTLPRTGTRALAPRPRPSPSTPCALRATRRRSMSPLRQPLESSTKRVPMPSAASFRHCKTSMPRPSCSESPMCGSDERDETTIRRTCQTTERSAAPRSTTMTTMTEIATCRTRVQIVARSDTRRTRRRSAPPTAPSPEPRAREPEHVPHVQYLCPG